MRFIFFSIVAVLALIAAVLAFKASDSPVATTAPSVQGGDTKQIEYKTKNIYLAKVNIPVGSIIDSSMLIEQPWPENLILENFVLAEQGGQEIVNKIARSSIAANEPFMKSKLANPNDPGFLAAGLPVGMKAITVATDTVTGIAGFIFPGDRVDVTYTYEEIYDVNDSSKVRTGKPTTTAVLGSNVRVLAVNLREADPAKPAVVTPSSITLEVTDELAQLIRLAEKNGTLAFSLRSIHDDSPTEIKPSGISDLSHSSGADLVVIRGPGSAGGKITASSSSTANEDNVSAEEVPAAPGAEVAPDSSVGENKVNK